MSDTPTPRERPTAAWLTEQEAKQEAYAARRRAWTDALDRAARARTEDAPEPPVAPTVTPTAVAEPLSARRPRGKVHDPRQERFEF